MTPNTPEVHVLIDEPNAGLTLPGHVLARCADGLDAVEIRLRFDGDTGPARALFLLGRASLEVLVRARQIQGLSK